MVGYTGSHFTSHHTRLHYKIFFFFFWHSPSGLGFYQNKLQNHFQHAALPFTSEWVGGLQISHKNPRWDLCYLCPPDMASFVKKLQVEAQYDGTELLPDTTRYWWTHTSSLTFSSCQKVFAVSGASMVILSLVILLKHQQQDTARADSDSSFAMWALLCLIVVHCLFSHISSKSHHIGFFLLFHLGADLSQWP